MKNIQKLILLLIIAALPFSVSFALPVELIYFNNSVNLNTVTLNWGTASESDNSGFRIERKRTDSTNWIDVGFVAGNGTTNKPHDYSFEDFGLANGTYNYRLKQIDFNGNFVYHDLSGVVIINTISITTISTSIEGNYKLYQNYPNPFNPVTVIRYSLIENAFTSLKVFNSIGKEVATLVNQNQNAGTFEVTFDGANLASGIYFYLLRSEGFSESKKMNLLK